MDFKSAVDDYLAVLYTISTNYFKGGFVMKRFLSIVLMLCMPALVVLAGCGLVDRARNDLNPLYFLDGAFYNMEIGPSEVTIDKDGDVEDARIYLLAEGKETKSHYEVTFHKGDDAAVATDLKDAPFQGTHEGYLKLFRYTLMCLIDAFPGKPMAVKYVPLGYNQNLSQYDALYLHSGDYDFEQVDAIPEGGHFKNYLEVTVGDAFYFVAVDWQDPPAQVIN